MRALPLFLSCFLIVSCGEGLLQEEAGDHLSSTSHAIIDSDLDPNYPQVVALMRRSVASGNWMPFCSATLVRNSSDEGARAWLLTASHCMSAYFVPEGWPPEWPPIFLEEDAMASNIANGELPDGTRLIDLPNWELSPEVVDSYPDHFFASDCVLRSYVPDDPDDDDGFPWTYEPGSVINDVALVRIGANFDGIQEVELGAPGTLPEGETITVTAKGLGMSLGCFWPGGNLFMNQTKDTSLVPTGSPEWLFDFHLDRVVGSGDSGGPVLYDGRLYGVHHRCADLLDPQISESTRIDHNESDCEGEDGPYDWIQARLVDHDDSRDCVAYSGGECRWLEAVRDGCDAAGENCCPAYTVWGDACVDNDRGHVTICHIPLGNPENEHTITVNHNALQAHLAHGDYPCACEGDDNE